MIVMWNCMMVDCVVCGWKEGCWWLMLLSVAESEEVKMSALVCAQRTSQPCRVGPSATSGPTSRPIGAIRSYYSHAIVSDLTVVGYCPWAKRDGISISKSTDRYALISLPLASHTPYAYDQAL
jgi:hypothetical protein